MTSRVAPPQADPHHGLPAHEVVLLLDTDPRDGLDDAEAERRLASFGPNLLPAAYRESVLLRMLRQFHHPLIYILIASGAITASLAEYVDSAVIFGVVLVNAVVGFVQESRAEAALDTLRSMVRTNARVVRGGQERTVPSEKVVPGDLVLVEAGDKVSADLRLVRLAQLRADESALTGESLPVVKDEVVLPAATPVADRRNMLYSGTLVTAGTGAGVTVATAAETELGEIHRLVGTAETMSTPLTEKLAWFSKVLTVVILVLAAVTFGIGLARGQGVAETFTAAIALAVGAIPEGLPAAVTITLAIGVGRMARQRAVIRRLPAVETLGGTTVICTDKTGTLTENQMTVRTVWTPDGEFAVTGSGYAPVGELRSMSGEHAGADAGPGGVGAGGVGAGGVGAGAVTAEASRSLWWSLIVGAACNDASLTNADGRWSIVGDPTEGALLVVAVKAGVDPAQLGTAFPRVATIPFSSERGYMATLHGTSASGHPALGTLAPEGRSEAPSAHVALVKGAVERVVELCSVRMTADGRVESLDHGAVLRAAERLATRGLRVLATAMRAPVQPEEFDESRLPTTMVLTGLHAMLDPPRSAAADAVRACHTAGISVKMITGDHAATAAAIARSLGLTTGGDGDTRGGDGDGAGEALTGLHLATLSTDKLPDAVDRARVFARVSPEQKLRLVQALQHRGHVVAMTGDGVNDAPALRQADIGVAMGRGGTEVAKDAADMVLTDDDFATIEAAVEEGRGVFDNLTKFIVWTLPTNMGEGLVILAAVLLGTALPILPTQILWINMTTAVALGLMLAFEPKETGIMSRPPRAPDRPLLTRALVARVLLVSALLVGGSWLVFEWELRRGADLEEARTVALNLFVVVEIFYLFSCRSLTQPMWRLGLLSNRWIVGGVTIQVLAQTAITYLPAMNTLFGTAPIDVASWLRILGVALLASLVVAVDKRLRPDVM